MSVNITVELPASEFAIGRVINAVDGVHIELESVVPLGDQAMPVLEVEDDDHDSFAQRLEEHPAVESVVAVEQTEDVGIYVAEWTEEPDSFYQILIDQNATIFSAIKDGDRWEFELRFPSQDALTAFRERTEKEGIDLDVRRVSRSQRSAIDSTDGLSAAQRETLELAVSQGYYSIPRKITTAELGEQLGVSDQAVVERLRRAMTNLGEQYITATRGQSRA